MSSSENERIFFVVDEYQSIPIGELRHIVGGTGAWIKSIIGRLLGSKAHPTYAVELRRMTKTKHIPKRMLKHFESLRSSLTDLSFLPNFEATIPAVGPYVSAIMAMSRRDGDIHFLAHRVTRKVGGELVDEEDFRFVSCLKDGRLMVTSTRNNFPRPRAKIDMIYVTSNDPGILLKKHRERMRQAPVRRVSPNEMYNHLMAENAEYVDNLLNRKIIREATPAEVARIRNEMRV